MTQAVARTTEKERTPLGVAVDCSLLSGQTGGLSRYLRALLPRMISLAGASIEWHLYARSVSTCADLSQAGQVNVRGDGLPEHLGRVLSLAVSQPVWARRDRPAVFWGPAHRLPLWLPQATGRVLTIHDVAWVRVPETLRRSTRTLDRALMGRSVASADRLIALSAATAADINSQWPESRALQRTRVIHGAAETLPPAESLAVCGPALRSGGFLLFVGTFEPRKNLPRLLEAYAMACKATAEFPPLVLVGGQGWGVNDLSGLIARHRLRRRVHLLGAVPDSVLSTLYSHALCLVLPSLHEGFGLPVVEALNYGLPVLVAEAGSLPEVAGPAGLLVDPLSVESIARGMLRIVKDTALHARLAAAAGDQASRYSWDEAAAATLSVLRDAASAAAMRSTSSRN